MFMEQMYKAIFMADFDYAYGVVERWDDFDRPVGYDHYDSYSGTWYQDTGVTVILKDSEYPCYLYSSVLDTYDLRLY